MKNRIISFTLVVVAIISLFSISASASTIANDTWYYGNLVTSQTKPGSNDTVYLPKGKTYTIKVGCCLSAGMTKKDKTAFNSFVKSCYFTVNIYTDTNKFVKSYTNLTVGDNFKLPTTVKKYRVDIIKHFPQSSARNSFIKDNRAYIGYRVSKV